MLIRGAFILDDSVVFERVAIDILIKLFYQSA